MRNKITNAEEALAYIADRQRVSFQEVRGGLGKPWCFRPIIPLTDAVAYWTVEQFEFAMDNYLIRYCQLERGFVNLAHSENVRDFAYWCFYLPIQAERQAQN